jgi:TrmH family RNA methyltransferase
MLSSTRILLLNTSHPGNIGAAARAMKTMGLEELCLVQPKAFPAAEATARASGADDLLARARVFDSLDEALQGCNLVIGASARARSIPCPLLDPRECAGMIAGQGGDGRAAILFGNEQSGLSNAEMDRCQYLVRIPANPEYSSLNLAAAVQIISYELRMASDAETGDVAGGQPQPVAVDSAEMERFYRHLEQVLVELDFLDPENPRQLMRRLRRLYNRAGPDGNEMNILRGILTATQQKSGGR